ncbi:MAG: transposase family protein [Gammaproteobacteria bacterium]|nr:transposase family protein [Gammaproteobacteria bacterium]
MSVPSAVMRPVPPPRKPAQQWGMDLTRLPKSSDGYCYLIVAVDHLTKWPEVRPIANKEATTILSFLDDICTRFGFPKVLITDQGREFNNRLVAAYCVENNIDHRMTSAYHPQSNGLTEKMNKSLKTGLRKLRESPKDWPAKLNCVLRGIRSHRPRATKYSPAEILYGFQPRLTAHSEEDRLEPPHSPTEDAESDDDLLQREVEDRMQKQENLHEMVRENIVHEQAKQKASYDAKHAPPPFHKGDKVLLQATRKRTRMGEELADNFTGPYTIAALTKANTAKLRDTNEKVLAKTVSLARLKHFHALESHLQGDDEAGPNMCQRDDEAPVPHEVALWAWIESNKEHFLHAVISTAEMVARDSGQDAAEIVGQLPGVREDDLNVVICGCEHDEELIQSEAKQMGWRVATTIVAPEETINTAGPFPSDEVVADPRIATYFSSIIDTETN